MATNTDLPKSNGARIVINHIRASKVFTNHDTVAGVLKVDVATELSASAIVIKLEGESKSIVSGLKKVGNRKKEEVATEIEAHKILYQSKQVFPPKELVDIGGGSGASAGPQSSGTYDGSRGLFGRHSSSNAAAATAAASQQHGNNTASSEKEYTLSPGFYEYPFEFTLPLKNHCVIDLQGFTNKFAFGKGGGLISTVNRNQELIKHVSCPLPPSLARVSYQNKSSIQYYIKATIKRSSFYKQNTRVVEPFLFRPLDFDFNEQDAAKLSYTRVEFPLKTKLGARSTASLPFYFEVRYGYPGYVVSNAEREAVPNLKFYLLSTFNFPQMIAEGSSAVNQNIVVDALKVDLVSYSTVLAELLRETVTQNFTILDESFVTVENPAKVLNFKEFKLSRGRNSKGEQLYELEVPAALFESRFNYRVLNSNELAPTFKTCNAKRDYRLIASATIRVVDSLAAATAASGASAAEATKATPTNLRVEADFKVFSGFPAGAVTLASEPDEHILNNQHVATSQTQAQAGPKPATYTGVHTSSTGSAAVDEKDSSTATVPSVGTTTTTASHNNNSLPAPAPRKFGNNYEAVAGDLTNKLASKLSKFSVKLGEENPKYLSQASKFSSFINKKNEFLQQKLNKENVAAAAGQSSASSTTDLSNVTFHGDDLTGSVPVVDTVGNSAGTANTTTDASSFDFSNLPPPPAYEAPEESNEAANAAKNAGTKSSGPSGGISGLYSNSETSTLSTGATPTTTTNGAPPGYQGTTSGNPPLDPYGYPVDRKDTHLQASSKLNSTNSDIVGSSSGLATPVVPKSPASPPPSALNSLQGSASGSTANVASPGGAVNTGAIHNSLEGTTGQLGATGTNAPTQGDSTNTNTYQGLPPLYSDIPDQKPAPSEKH